MFKDFLGEQILCLTRQINAVSSSLSEGLNKTKSLKRQLKAQNEENENRKQKLENLQALTEALKREHHTRYGVYV